jgi:hypothetical protein
MCVLGLGRAKYTIMITKGIILCEYLTASSPENQTQFAIYDILHGKCVKLRNTVTLHYV